MPKSPWLSTYNTPNITDASFDAQYNCIDLKHDDANLRSVIYCTPDKPGLLFLYRIRHAVDEAIKHNLDYERRMKYDNPTSRG